MAGLDGDVVVHLHIVGVRVDAVLAGTEHIAQNAARAVAREDLTLRKVLAELAHQHAELSGGNIHHLRVMPFPRPRIPEVAALWKHFLLNALVLRPGGEDRLGRQIAPRLLQQDCDLPVLRLDPPAVPYPQRQHHKRRKRARAHSGAYRLLCHLVLRYVKP